MHEFTAGPACNSSARMPAAGSAFAKGHRTTMSIRPSANPLAVLVVDDEALIAMVLEDLLRHLGCEVIGPAGDVSSAIDLIGNGDRALDGAILDVNLRGELVYPVADALQSRGVPFVFVSGYADYGIDPRYAAIPAMAKPFPAKMIDDIVASFEQRRRAKLEDEAGTVGNFSRMS
jgi:two-component SAPR family response regulator